MEMPDGWLKIKNGYKSSYCCHSMREHCSCSPTYPSWDKIEYALDLMKEMAQVLEMVRFEDEQDEVYIVLKKFKSWK